MDHLPDGDRFKQLCKLQDRFKDLMILCLPLQMLVTIPWPTGHDGEKINPKLICDLLERLQLEWPCFCTLASNSTVSSRMIVTDRRAFALCRHIPSVCGFHSQSLRLCLPLHLTHSTVDLDKVYELTTLAKEFAVSLTLHFHQDSAAVVGRIAHYFGEHKAG
ncbi:hypothetical protein B0H17DRAFT_1149568 [Mycena rosella]|uniref:Uncharacterized protein n=1 Tax=Mycena rosella TaxID=1033263 RepID=A0AAD7C0R9_MYCRO|nr:hypothetical protein B0H17DRAFT_1149568 [Mycena rosella]